MNAVFRFLMVIIFELFEVATAVFRAANYLEASRIFTFMILKKSVIATCLAIYAVCVVSLILLFAFLRTVSIATAQRRR